MSPPRVALYSPAVPTTAPARDPALQFAVVREDPRVELDALAACPARAPRVLLIGSAGCTALALHQERPDAAITLLDPNPAQHAHVEAKVRALVDRAPLATFNVGDDDPAGLSERGNFEALFRQLRGFLHEFVAPRGAVDAAAQGDRAAMAKLLASAYWPVAFELFFSDALLVAMFGPAAIQHAVPGSYPTYFRRVYTSMLGAPGARRNPFVQHLLRGCYDDDARPVYLQRPSSRAPRFEHRVGTLDDVDDFGVFDLVHLSNVFDWSDAETVRRLSGRVGRELRPGARVTLRQLNNEAPVESAFPGLTFERRDAEASHFYNRVLTGVKA